MSRRTLGICAPITISELTPHLKPGTSAHPIRGLGGSPIGILARGALDLGWRVVIFSLDKEACEEVVFDGPRLKICIGPYRLRARSRAVDGFRVERNYLCHALEREKPDVVHAHWTYEFALAALASGKPCLVTAHDAPLRILQLYPDPYRLIRTLMAYKVMRTAKHVTAVSGYVADHLRRYLCPPVKIDVVPNAISPEWFRDQPPDRPSDSDVTFAAVLSDWGELKNCASLLRAFPAVQRDIRNARLLLFGNNLGPNSTAESWARERDLTRGVEFVGPVHRNALLHRLKSDVDILVHPSLEEACCMAIAEALALGIPVIGGRESGGVPDMLEHGRVGLLCDVKSPEELATEMIRLGRDAGLRNHLGNAGLISARNRFSIGRVMTAYNQLYEQISEC